MVEGRLTLQRVRAARGMKKVLVTGAGSGFGLEAAMRLAEKGFEDLRQRRSQTRARPRRAYLRPCSHSLWRLLTPWAEKSMPPVIGAWSASMILMFLSALKRANRRKDSLPLTGQSCGR